jgi:hypothetical protein
MVLLASARSGSLIAGSIGLAVGAVLYQFRQPPRRRVTLSTGEDAG